MNKKVLAVKDIINNKPRYHELYSALDGNERLHDMLIDIDITGVGELYSTLITNPETISNINGITIEDIVQILEYYYNNGPNDVSINSIYTLMSKYRSTHNDTMIKFINSRTNDHNYNEISQIIYKVYSTCKPGYYDGIDYNTLNINIEYIYDDICDFNARCIWDESCKSIIIQFNIISISNLINEYNCDPEYLILFLIYHELSHYHCDASKFNFGEIACLTSQTLYNNPLLNTIYNKHMHMYHYMHESFVDLIGLDWILDKGFIPDTKYNEIFGIAEYVFGHSEIIADLFTNHRIGYPHDKSISTPIIQPIKYGKDILNNPIVPFKFEK